jgi:hypothetical protein
VRDDPRELIDRPGRCVDVRSAKPRTKQVIATEDVQRQVAVVAVEAVEEAALLVAMERIVRRVEVEGDLLRRLVERLDEHVEEHLIDEVLSQDDAPIPIGLGFTGLRQLDPVERALSGEPSAVVTCATPRRTPSDRSSRPPPPTADRTVARRGR